MAAEDLDAVTRRLADTLTRGRDEALDLVDLACRLAPEQALVAVRVDDVESAVLSLLRSAQVRKRESDAARAAARLAELSDELDSSRGYSAEELGARMVDRAERIVLLAQSDDIEAAVAAANEALGWVGDGSLRDEPLDVLLLELRADLLWAAADAFGDNDVFSEALRVTGEALARSGQFAETSRPEIQDHLALKVGERALTLVDAGWYSTHHLAQARTALNALSDAGRNEASGLSLRLRWAVASRDDQYAADVFRSADATGLTHVLDTPPCRRAGVELLNTLPTAEAWRQELGPFAAPIYAEARGVALAQAYVWLGEHPPAAGSEDDGWPPRTLIIGRLVVGDVDTDLDTLVRDHYVREERGVRSVPTASLRAYLASSSDPQIAPWIAAGAQAASAGGDIHHQVAAMLAYFDRHGTPTEASFACAAILAGVVSALLAPDALASYAHYLRLFDHDIALEKAVHGG